MERAELIARQILRNDQVAVRSAKETILDMIGRNLDDQLRVEAINGYRLPREKKCYLDCKSFTKNQIKEDTVRIILNSNQWLVWRNSSCSIK